MQNFDKLFEFLSANLDKVEIIVASDSNTLFIDWLLEHY